MFFNLGKYEVAIIVIVAFFFVGVPIVSWLVSRRRQQVERAEGRR